MTPGGTNFALQKGGSAAAGWALAQVIHWQQTLRRRRCRRELHPPFVCSPSLPSIRTARSGPCLQGLDLDLDQGLDLGFGLGMAGIGYGGVLEVRGRVGRMSSKSLVFKSWFQVDI